MPDPPKISLDSIAEAYILSRDKISELNAEIDKIKVVQGKREQWLQAELSRQGLQNAKTAHGTVYSSLKESVTVGEWDTFIDFAVVKPIVEAVQLLLDGEPTEGTVAEVIKAAIKLEFLNKAVSKKEVLDCMGEKRDQTPPPGINYSSVRTAQIRKS